MNKAEWEEAGFESQEAFDAYEAAEWNDSCAAMKVAEDRWVDNGCSNVEHYDEDNRVAF